MTKLKHTYRGSVSDQMKLTELEDRAVNSSKQNTRIKKKKQEEKMKIA